MPKYTNQDEVIAVLNALNGYEGYVQFSNRQIEDKDVFRDGSIHIVPPEENALLYEAHFFSPTTTTTTENSITVRYINGSWYLDETSTAEATGEDIQSYQSHYGVVNMAQIWEAVEDEDNHDFKALKLSKVVFAGFDQGGDS